MRTIKILFLVKLFLLGVTNVNAQNDKVMATYLYNFIKFIDWPVASQNEEFVIGVIGETPVYKELEKLVAGRKVYNHPIVLKKFADATVLTRCHVIFLPDNYSDKIDCILNKFKLFNTLIVCERSGMIKKGSAISFVVQHSKLKYELSKTNIKNSGLHVDNQLGLLAANVE
jgi:hypothetical protein